MAISVADTGSGMMKRPEIPRGQGELILVVDDEPYIREMTKAALEAMGNLLLLTSALGPQPVDHSRSAYRIIRLAASLA